MNIKLGSHAVGDDAPVFVIAEMSANHNHDMDRAVKILEAAVEAGADAVKLQTYTPDTITIDSDNQYFRIKGTLWEGQSLHSLYKEAYMPWEWQPRLKKVADELGVMLFSSPFDHSAVDFLEEMDVAAYKLASFEVVDLPLIRKIASTGKPMIMSTGMADLDEIQEAVDTFHDAGGKGLVLLKCTSAYPALAEDANLRTIPDLAQRFGVPAGLSDHTLGSAVAVTSVALGACVVEKHFTLSREAGGPDASFSMEPDEFKAMVRDIRIAEKSLGKVTYEITEKQKASRNFRRSLFFVEDVQKGEIITGAHVRSIRPSNGLHTRHLEEIIGKKASRDIERGTPCSWELIE
ncbi:pseudaminic acid synthase [Salidesulfovibrio onnuriiensis]|uniref:pseudaminic acid synthase n=1 Tax=Salidesulfovibrio onnuriiensis TaxID=2583823 RepID=UPI0011CB4FB2|nr:pseudaminic acid synthase [Salidesulfovibrio onnuriiensis]